MSVSQDNVDTVFGVLEAINRRDARAALQGLHRDAEYIDHREASQERFRGHDAFRAHFEGIWRAAPDGHIDAEPIADRGELVVMKQTVTATDQDGNPTTRIRWVTRAVRDGLISRVEVFDGECEALEAAGLKGRQP